MIMTDHTITYPSPRPVIEPGLDGRLRTARELFKLSLTQMDQLLFLGSGTWRTYEVGNMPPPTRTLAALAREGININWLLTGQGPAEVQPYREGR